MTKLDTATTPPLADQIVALEAEIAQMQERWKRYARIQPVRTSTMANPLQYDPVRLIEKQHISLQIDEAQIRLHERQRHAAALADMKPTVAKAEQVLQQAVAVREDAERAYREATVHEHDQRYRLSLLVDRQKSHETGLAQAEHAGKRWTDEQIRDQEILADAQDFQDQRTAYLSRNTSGRAA